MPFPIFMPSSLPIVVDHQDKGCTNKTVLCGSCKTDREHDNGSYRSIYSSQYTNLVKTS